MTEAWTEAFGYWCLATKDINEVQVLRAGNALIMSKNKKHNIMIPILFASAVEHLLRLSPFCHTRY